MKWIFCLIIVGVVALNLVEGEQRQLKFDFIPTTTKKTTTTTKPTDTKTRSTVIVTPKSIGKSHSDALDELQQTFKLRSIDSREERSNLLRSTLEEVSLNSQSSVLEFLTQQKSKDNRLEVNPLWISSQIIVKNADSSLVNKLKSRPDVAKVEPDQTYSIGDTSAQMMRNMNSTAQWGVRMMGTMQVWYNMSICGDNITVAAIDSGVRYTHEALRDNYRSSYGWFDAIKGTQTPNDDVGHGTHVVGTICGTTNGIGVAPNAQWIACKACDKSGCELSHLLACGQWIACPTDPTGTTKNCSAHPNIVSNSWGGRGGNPNYEHIIRVWRDLGIIPVYAAGNSGPICLTMASPAESTQVITVGSVDEGDKLSRFSSRGPTYLGGVRKPDVLAPGGEVVSASHKADDMYVKMSGTSMACPHVSGVVALMLEKNPEMEFNTIKERLQSTANPAIDPNSLVRLPGIFSDCGLIQENVIPNNQLGWGRVDAARAVDAS